SLLCKKFYDSFYIRSQTNSSSFRSYCQIQNCLSDDEVLDSDSTVDNDEIVVESEVVDNDDVVVEAVEITSVVDGDYETATKKANGVNSKIRFNFTKILGILPFTLNKVEVLYDPSDSESDDSSNMLPCEAIIAWRASAS